MTTIFREFSDHPSYIDTWACFPIVLIPVKEFTESTCSFVGQFFSVLPTNTVIGNNGKNIYYIQSNEIQEKLIEYNVYLKSYISHVKI